MSATDKRKQSLYFPETMLQEIQKEAARLDRSLSWIVQRCVKIGLSDIRKLPSVNDVSDDLLSDATFAGNQDLGRALRGPGSEREKLRHGTAGYNKLLRFKTG